ncbi:hypothetical protein AURDEDRAFT_110320 [Auricularia subglabra TFB-10046 SS5]|nr:hypothetical protein AURDEDRAFT_110320 [Auricularia subglabra TFB-10046 SS5]
MGTDVPARVLHPKTGKPILGDLPLEKYVLQSFEIDDEVGMKRGQPFILSPHKRRMLENAGKLSPSKRDSPASRARASILAGSASPARRLDFSSMAALPSPATPRRATADADENPFVSEQTPTGARPPPKLVPSPDIQGSVRAASPAHDHNHDENDENTPVNDENVPMNDENAPVTDENAYPTPAATQENDENVPVRRIPLGFGPDWTMENQENCRPMRPLRTKKAAGVSPKPLRPRASSPAPLLAASALSPRRSLPAGSIPGLMGAPFFAQSLPADATLKLDHQPTDVQRKRGRAELEMEVDEMDTVDDLL